MPKPRLEKLESIRGLAAAYVVLHHLSHAFLSHRWARLPFAFGPEAVMIFFVLSGFVIYYSSANDPLEMQVRNYSIKRIRRIYPIFLAAMFIAYCCRAIVLRYWFIPSFKLAAGNLFMLQGISIDPFYDGPLWSLSYEWWFYVLFLIVFKIEKNPAKRQYWAAGLSLLGLVSAAIYLNQASLFLLYFISWWSGAELARQYMAEGRITWRGQRFALAAFGCLAFSSLVLLVPAIRAKEHLGAMDPPFLFCRHLIAGFLLVQIGIFWYHRRFIAFDRLIGPFAIFAPISYAIYAIHAPIIDAVTSLQPGKMLAIKLIAIVTAVLAIGYVLEALWQPQINRWSRKYLIGKATPGAGNSRPLGQVAAA